MLTHDITLKTPEENILYDDVLLFLAEKGVQGEALRFWESKELFVCLGRIGKVDDDVNLEEVRNEDIAMLRRSSGGGTVLQGPGCLNYSLILSKDKHPQIRDIKKSYQYILGKVADALGGMNVGAVVMPISDIAIKSENKKISGNAQRRGRNFVLHHGTILYDFDLRAIEQFLRMPKEFPEYRRDREHEAFVANVSIDTGQFKEKLRKSFNSTEQRDILSDKEKNHLNHLLEEKRVIISK